MVVVVVLVMAMMTDQQILFEEERLAIVLGSEAQGGVRESLRQCLSGVIAIGECGLLIGRERGIETAADKDK